MRQTSKIQVKVRDVVIGGHAPLICLPLMGEQKDTLLQEAKELVLLQPDLIEWRVDTYRQVEDIEECLLVLGDLRLLIGNIPLIFTCRIDLEGGLKKISQTKRLELIEAAIKSGNVDIVDIELCNEESFTQAVKKAAADKEVKLIFSYHNFLDTPEESFIYAKLVEAQDKGADIAKLAVMPNSYGDVLILLQATNRARNESIHGPIVTISMGEEGAISRLAGGLFGSDITFAVGKESSAPGQMPIEALKTGMTLLYDDKGNV